MNNIIVISDTHCGCQFGLFDPNMNFKFDGGGQYLPSPSQLAVWEAFKEFKFDWVPMVTKGEKYIIVHLGDCLDGNHHKSVTQITSNLERQRDIAYQVLAPFVMHENNKKCVGYYHIRGTEAHVGSSGQEEESVAKSLGAVQQKDTGNYARWELWLRLNNILCHFSHHIGNTSSSSYESTAVYKEMVESFNEAGRWHNEPPDVVARGHRHRQFETRIATEKGYGISLVCPGWQLKTPFSYRMASGRVSTPQIGGYLIRTGDEDEVFTRFFVKKIGRTEEVVL